MDYNLSWRLRAAWVSKRDYYGEGPISLEKMKATVEREWVEWLTAAGVLEEGKKVD